MQLGDLLVQHQAHDERHRRSMRFLDFHLDRRNRNGDSLETAVLMAMRFHSGLPLFPHRLSFY
jgi:hypothetical protein